ncbi:MAG TPA: hypothetical protein VKX49_26455 [Bryobacteraceae bacterium]|jgi:hypothetical protein|nr:hypothetical protein [Bryobacteraceae bacterium]
MVIQSTRLCLLSYMAVVMTGCSLFAPKNPRSAIVEKVEQAGAGDLSTASTQTIQQWLGKHRELANEVENLCKPVRRTADAKWANSTEGRVCSAAHTLAFFHFEPKQGDGEVFHSGWR